MRCLFLAMGLLLVACDGQQANGPTGGAPPLTEVGVACPISKSLPVERDLTGSVEAIEWVQVMPRIGGLVERVKVANGAEVKSGDELLQLDEEPYKIALASAQAAITGAQARLANAKMNLERSRGLVDEHAISAQQLNDIEAVFHTAEAEAASAKAGVDAATLNLRYTRVTAPIDGRIARISATVGNLVVAGGAFPGTVITTLVKMDPVYVAFDLDEQTWRTIGHHLLSASDGGGHVPVSVQLEGEPTFSHHGSVAFADNQVDSATGSIRIRARIPNADRSLTPGAFARVRLEVSAPRPVLLINEAAVQSQLSTRFVYVVDEKGITSFRPVILGDRSGNLLIVESGLSADERIVVSGLSKVFFLGMGVKVRPVSMEDPTQSSEAQSPKTTSPGAPAVKSAAHPDASPATGDDKPGASNSRSGDKL